MNMIDTTAAQQHVLKARPYSLTGSILSAHSDAVDDLYGRVLQKYGSDDDKLILKEHEYIDVDAPTDRIKGEFDIGIWDIDKEELLYVEVKSSSKQIQKAKRQLERAEDYFTDTHDYGFEGWIAVLEDWDDCGQAVFSYRQYI